MALSRLGGEMQQQSAPVTLPKFAFAESDVEAEAREAQARVVELRTVRVGRDCWQQIGRSNCFESWVKIAAALAVGRDFALRATGANRPEGQIYCKAFSRWITDHGFASMQKSLRSVALEMHTHINEITAWRETLSGKQRRRLQGPQQNVRRWKAETGQVTESNRPRDTARAAMVAFNRFVTLVQTLPDDKAAPLWQAVHTEAAMRIAP